MPSRTCRFRRDGPSSPPARSIRKRRDEVLLPVLNHWRIFDLAGLDGAAEAARRRLAEHLDSLDAAAKRFEEKLASSVAPRLVRAG